MIVQLKLINVNENSYIIKAQRECLAIPNKSITQNTNRILRTPIVNGHLKKLRH